MSRRDKHDPPLIDMTGFIPDADYGVGKPQDLSDDPNGPMKYKDEIHGTFEDVVVSLLAKANAKLDLVIAIGYVLTRRFGVEREEIQQALKTTHDAVRVETIKIDVD